MDEVLSGVHHTRQNLQTVLLSWHVSGSSGQGSSPGKCGRGLVLALHELGMTDLG
jgi:hypothetical protein